MKNIYLLILLASTLLFSCVEDYDLDIKDYSSSYSIEAIISNKADYNYVRIAIVQPGVNMRDALTYGMEKLEKSIAVENARVYISDSKGNISEFKIKTDGDFFYYSISGYGKYEAPEGFKAVVGETYTLKVIIGNEVFTSTSTVIEAPEIISIVVRKTKLEIQKEESYVPYISFIDVDPTVANYFVTVLQSDWDPSEDKEDFRNISDSRTWAYSIFNDEFLNTIITDYKIDFGTAPDHSAWYPMWNTYQRVVLMAVDKETYEYYKILISQVKNEGGMYSQTPASPRSNIKGGALGFFMATNISMATAKAAE